MEESDLLLLAVAGFLGYAYVTKTLFFAATLPAGSSRPTGATGPSLKDSLEAVGIGAGAGLGCVSLGGGAACGTVAGVASVAVPAAGTWLTSGTPLPKEALYVAPVLTSPLLAVKAAPYVWGGAKTAGGAVRDAAGNVFNAVNPTHWF